MTFSITHTQNAYLFDMHMCGESVECTNRHEKWQIKYEHMQLIIETSQEKMLKKNSPRFKTIKTHESCWTNEIAEISGENRESEQECVHVNGGMGRGGRRR